MVRTISPAGIVATYAGTGEYGTANGSRSDATFGLPEGIAVAGNGTVYLADTGNNRLRKIDPNGSVSTLLIELKSPKGLALGSDALYIAEWGANRILKYSLGSGSLSTLTGEIRAPNKIVLSSDGAWLYAVDNGNYRVVRISTSSGAVSVVAGSGAKGYLEGVGTAALFNDPAGIGLDPDTNTLYVGDIDSIRNAMIRKIDLGTNATEQWVYDSSMTAVNERSSMRVLNGYLYLAGTGTIHRYKLSNPADNNVVGGADRYQLREGALAQALIARPVAMALSHDREWLYIAGAHKIVKVYLPTGQLSFVIGSSVDNYVEGQGSTARFSGISGIVVNAANDTLYVVDRFNNRIRGVRLADNTSFLVSGGGEMNTTGPSNGYAEGDRDSARFANPVDLVFSPGEQYLYVSDAGNHRIRRVTTATGATALISGSGAAGFKDGPAESAKFDAPFGLALSESGQTLYVADRNNHRIRRVRVSDGSVATLAGSGGAGYRDAMGTAAVFNLPTALALDGDRLFIADTGSHRVRVLELNGNVSKLALGSGKRGYQNGDRTSVRLNSVSGLTVNPATSQLYVADTWNDVLRSVDIQGTAPFTDDRPIVARVEPDTLKKRGSQAHIAVRGAGFRHGITVLFGDVEVQSFVESSKKLAVIVPISRMQTGWYDIRVTNLDGQTDTLTKGFGLGDATTGAVPNRVFAPPTGTGFLAFETSSRRGVEVAAGDLDGDGLDEIVTAQSTGGNPVVRLYEADGTLIRQFRASHSRAKKGLTVGVGDVDGDGVQEIVTAPRLGTFEVRIYDPSGKLEKRFWPLGKRATTGGSVAVGDVDGDGLDDIVVGAYRDSTRVLAVTGTGRTIVSFRAYSGRNGVRAAVGDVNGDGRAEIVTAPRKGAILIRVFEGASGKRVSQQYAFSRRITSGANVAVGDVTGDGVADIAIGRRTTRAEVSTRAGSTLARVGSFYAFPAREAVGANVAVGDLDGDGRGEVVTGRAQGLAEVIPYTYTGTLVTGL